MIKIKKLLPLLLLSITPLSQADIIYHCPSIQDITFSYGTFKATTHYNGVTIDWFSSQYYSGGIPKIKKFNFTNHYNDCVQGTCQIYCVYQLHNHDVLRFFVTGERYRFLNEVGGPWAFRSCATKKPEACTFSIIQRENY